MEHLVDGKGKTDCNLFKGLKRLEQVKKVCKSYLKKRKKVLANGNCVVYNIKCCDIDSVET